jgi:hypothetical protein
LWQFPKNSLFYSIICWNTPDDGLVSDCKSITLSESGSLN